MADRFIGRVAELDGIARAIDLASQERTVPDP
jgi:hypothetical protein